jgi:U32 family peptidase
MKLTATLNHQDQIAAFKKAQVEEVILECRDFSRFGQWSLEEVQQLASLIAIAGLRPVLQWDLLQTQHDFAQTIKKIKQLNLSLFSAIRIQEMGAFHFALRELNIPIHLILETAHHNFMAISSLLDMGGEKIERVILSQELEARLVKQYTELLHQRNIEAELLVLGPILLFYTPRKLLGLHFEDEFDATQKQPLKSWATSEESPHSGFTVIENQHGTFMFHTKDHALFDQPEIVANCHLDWGRFEGGQLNDLALQNECLTLLNSCLNLQDSKAILALKSLYPKKLFRGFFGVNKTDALFSKLKNARVARSDEAYVGEVLDADKDQYIALSIKAQNTSLSVGDKLRMMTPEGRERLITIKRMRNTQGQEVTNIPSGHIAIIPWSGGLVRKTIAYRG